MPALRFDEDLTCEAANDDVVCESQQPSAGGEQSLTLVGSASEIVLDRPRHLLVTSDADDSGRTFTITGTGYGDYPLVYEVTGPNTTTVEVPMNFKTVTEVTVDDDTAGNIKVGTNDAFDSTWYVLDLSSQQVFNLSMLGVTSAGASLTWGVEITLADPQTTNLNLRENVPAKAHDTLAGESDTQLGTQTSPVTAIRVNVSSFSSGTLNFAALQLGP